MGGGANRARTVRRFAVAGAGALIVGVGVVAGVAPSGAAGYLRCHPNQLSVRIGREGAALGHIGVEVRLVNVSAGACTLQGYPGLQLLDGDDHALPTEVHRGVADTVPRMAERRVIVRPHGPAPRSMPGGMTAPDTGSSSAQHRVACWSRRRTRTGRSRLFGGSSPTEAARSCISTADRSRSRRYSPSAPGLSHKRD